MSWRTARSWLGGKWAWIVVPALLLALAANLYLGILDKGLSSALFDWTLLVLGAAASFVIVNFIIRAHEHDRWRRFRQNMVWDLYLAVCELIESYDKRAEYMAPRKRRYEGDPAGDYYQSADAPVTLRRFKTELERRRAEVSNIMGLGLVGITPETAQGIAGFKATYNQLFAVTRFIIDADDATGPAAPDDFQQVSAWSAYVSLFPMRKPVAVKAPESTRKNAPTKRFAESSDNTSDGPFTRLLDELDQLASQVELEFETIAGDDRKTFIAPDVEPEDSWVQEHLRLHKQRRRVAEKLDKRLRECADFVMQRPGRPA